MQTFPPPVEPWPAALPRRVGTLARVTPLTRFEQTKGARKLDLERHDLRTLALMVFDVVVETMGLASGATRADIAAGLAPLIRAAETEADRERIMELSDLMIDLLMNESARRAAFCEEVRVPAENGVQTRRVEFHYLRQVHGLNDETLYRATVEGINLYTGTLGLDLEDAQTANAAVLKYQIGRGKFREAVASAKQALAITAGYEVKLERALRAAERDIAQVDWAGEMLRMLGEARGHLRERLDSDGEICAAVQAAQDDAEEKERPHIAALLRHMQECQQRNTRLHQRILAANDEWLGQHARQSFRPRAVFALPDLEAQVLRAALPLTARDWPPDECWQVAAGFLGTRAPRVMGPLDFIEMLLAPPRDYERPELPPALVELEEAGRLVPFFSDEDERIADLALASVAEEEIRVSELLARRRLAGMSTHHRTLVYLKTLLSFGEEPERVELAGVTFADEPFSGDDLMLRPCAAAPVSDDDGLA
jgi:hypothetical protein